VVAIFVKKVCIFGNTWQFWRDRVFWLFFVQLSTTMYSRLLLPVLFILLECSLCIKHVAGYFIHIDAHAEECFFDRVTSGTKLSLMFEVAEGGFLDIDVRVGFPNINLCRVDVKVKMSVSLSVCHVAFWPYSVCFNPIQ